MRPRRNAAKWRLNDQRLRLAMARRGYRTYADLSEAVRYEDGRSLNRSRIPMLVGGTRCGDGTAEMIAAALDVEVADIFDVAEPSWRAQGAS